MHMLYSTREKIPSAALEYLSKIPDEVNKKQCESDIPRSKFNLGSNRERIYENNDSFDVIL
jgi:hypothetical protein